ncbi:hypothetical protein [Tindallia californiensis]|uniref:ComK protein n=1 Tax=Tindallia californiensis TaxID=159292 RepID=A0A1H3PD61_9FIRM|nr:hypothetical protein [Tindallia californiensis]SDY99092.1 hypothetical protein SAMN05192546_106151 [Tindallia californiensis]
MAIRNREKKAEKEVTSALKMVRERPLEVEGFYPVQLAGYGEGMKMLCREDEEKEYAIRADRFTACLTEGCFYNIKMAQRYLSQQLQVTYRVPIPLGREMILVPFKTRSRRIQGDSMIGYVNWHRVERVTSRGKIVLKSGREFPCLNKGRTVRQRMVQAQLGAVLMREYFEGKP